MPKYIIAVEWEEYGQFEVEAETLEEAKEMVYDSDEKYNIGNADGEYVDNSFKVNDDCCYEVKE